MSRSVQEFQSGSIVSSRPPLVWLFAASLLFLLAGCGGGSSGTATDPPVPAATVTTWEIIDLGVLHDSEEAYSAAYDINDNGVVVGESGPVFSERHGFYWESGAMVSMPDLSAKTINAVNNSGVAVGNTSSLGGTWGLVIQKNGEYDYVAVPDDWTWSKAHDINNLGDIVGSVSVAGGQERGFILRHDGSFTVIEPLPGDAGSYVMAINDSGAVAGVSVGGYYYDQYRGFLFAEGSLTEISFVPEDINNRGEVVGSRDGQAYLYSNGATHPLGYLPGDNYSLAYGINDAGDIVGRSGSRAFLRKHNGEMVDLAALPEVQEIGWSLFEARAINNAGQIVGQTGQYAFLLTPRTQPQ